MDRLLFAFTQQPCKSHRRDDAGPAFRHGPSCCYQTSRPPGGADEMPRVRRKKKPRTEGIERRGFSLEVEWMAA
jgi:hypothetical protein